MAEPVGQLVSYSSVDRGPRISVVIPTYNRAGLVSRALESVLAQTRPADEVMVIDDGSTDDTRAVVTSFGPRVTYIRQENSGASVARNAGVRAASSEWIAFLDSDDVWLPEYLERMAAAIEETEGVAEMYFADLKLAADGGATLWERAGFAVTGRYELATDASAWLMLPRHPVTTQATVIRRAGYLEAGGQDPEIACRHDTHLFFRLGLGRPACAVAGVGAVLMDDAGAEDRLTGVHDPDSRSYLMDTLRLYADLLKRGPKISLRDRQILRRRLAFAQWKLGLLDWKERGALSGLLGIAASLASAPSVPLGRVLAKTRAAVIRR